MTDNNNQIDIIKKTCFNVRRNILEMALNAGASSSHFGGGLSSVEILSTLYNFFLKYDSKNPEWENRDRFILSKGHGCISYYSILFEKGFLSKDDLLTFEKNNSELLGHPVVNRKKGIEFSNGSLGMGLSLGIGLALSSKKKKNTNFNVFVMIGDGECNEGSVWEAAMSAPFFKLDNLTVILDNNRFQQTGSNDEIMRTSDFENKWKSFGWNTILIDGHDIEQIINAFKKNFNNDKPKIILASTIKGKGFSFSENNNDWHHHVLSKKQYDEAIKELNSND